MRAGRTKVAGATEWDRTDITGRRQLSENLVVEHYEPLLSYANFLLGERQAVEDVVHQAFMLALDRLAGGRPFEGDPGKWLRGTVRNLVREVWRQQRRLPQDVAELLDEVLDRADDPAEAIDRSRLSRVLRQCLEGLDEEDRELIKQRYEGGRRIVDIARELNLNLATARVRLFRVRQALRSCVEGRLAGEVQR